MNKNKAYLIAMTAVVMILLCAIYQSDKKEEYNFDTEKDNLIKDYWELYFDNQHVSTVSLPYHISYHFGKKMPKKMTLKKNIILDRGKDNYICFRTVQQKVTVSIDNNCVYEYGKDLDNQVIKTSPGNIWNTVRLPNNELMCHIEIELESSYPSYAGVIGEVRIGERSELRAYLAKHHFLEAVLGILIIFASIVILLIMFFVKKLRTDKVIYLGINVLLTGIWMITGSKLIQFYISDTNLVTLINVLIPMMLAVVVSLYILTLDEYMNSSYIKTVLNISMLNFVGVVFLQVYHILDFYQVYISTVLVFLLIFCKVTQNTIIKVIQSRSIKSLTIKDWGCIIMEAGFITDMILFYKERVVDTAKTFRYGICIYILCILIWYIRRLMEMSISDIRARAYKEMAFRDGLTGLNNRAAFEKNMDLFREKNDQTPEIASVIIIDINNLKDINDTLGHKKGDMAITEVAEALRRSFVNYGNIYRIGGDEFCILAPYYDEMSINHYLRVTQRYLKKVYLDEDWALSIAFGVAKFSIKRGDDIDDVFTKADKNMYQCKFEMKTGRQSKYEGKDPVVDKI